MKFNKRQFIAFVVIVLVMAGFIIVNHPVESQIKTAEKVLFNLLNAPNAELETAYDNLFLNAEASSNTKTSDNNGSPGIESLNSIQVERTVSELLENRATESFLESCIQINEIMSLQHYAMMDGFKSKLLEFSIDTTQQKEVLEYDAVLLISMDGREDQLIHASGLVQFNHDAKISAITLQSKELSTFYVTLTPVY